MKKYLAILGVTLCVSCGNQKSEEILPKSSTKETLCAQQLIKNIAGELTVKDVQASFDTLDQEWRLVFEAHDALDLVPVFQADDLNPEVTHYFYCAYKKDSAENWGMELLSYRLNYFSKKMHYPDSISKDTMLLGFGSYSVSLYGGENGNIWLCDFWPMKRFPWLTEKQAHPGFNQFSTNEEAIKKIAPPHAVSMYDVLTKLTEKDLLCLSGYKKI